MRKIALLSLCLQIYASNSYKNLECAQNFTNCHLIEVGDDKKSLKDVKIDKGPFKWAFTGGKFITMEIINAEMNEISCDYIPVILKSFAKVKLLTVRNCGKFDINEKTFETAPTLENFTMEFGEFKKFSSKIFSKLKVLKILELRGSEIEEISFVGPNQLQIIDLSSNSLKILSTSAFEISNLKKLDLSSNLLETLADGVFVGCPNLEILNVSFNQISSLPKETFNSLPKLQILDLSHNNLTNLEENLLDKLRQLTCLKLDNNSITELKSFVFFRNRNLQKINLSHNQISKISKQTFEAINFGVLDLRGNVCVDADIKSLSQLDNCTRIEIQEPPKFEKKEEVSTESPISIWSIAVILILGSIFAFATCFFKRRIKQPSLEVSHEVTEDESSMRRQPKLLKTVRNSVVHKQLMKLRRVTFTPYNS